jgi:hypothetical protein
MKLEDGWKRESGASLFFIFAVIFSKRCIFD